MGKHIEDRYSRVLAEKERRDKLRHIKIDDEGKKRFNKRLNKKKRSKYEYIEEEY